MRDRLAGRASQALAEQKNKLANELAKSLTPENLSSPDSLKKLEKQLKTMNSDSLKKVATGLFNSLFKSPKRDTAKAPAPAASDTTPH